MRIVVWGINYAPEVTGIGPYNTVFCEYLQAQGHEVEMVTTFPYYPGWKKLPADRATLWRSEVCHGVRVHRCWHYVPSHVRWWKRIIHEATFILTSLPRILTRPRADLIVAVSPPLPLGPAVWLVSRLHRTRYLFHVQDLQPDAAVGVGLLRQNLFTRALYAVEAFAYRKAWRVSGISRGMLSAFAEKGVPPEKHAYFPNGIQLDEMPARGAFRARHGFGVNEFLAIYAGNIGVKQGLIVLVLAARLLKDRSIQLVICGDGAQRALIEREASGLENIHFLPLLPAGEYREMLVDCDLAVIPQLAGSGQAFFPSKLLNPLAAGRAVLSVADEKSELARAVAESGCGRNVPPNWPEGLALALEELAREPASLTAYGQAGRKWVEQFEQSRVLAAFMEVIERASSGGTRKMRS